MAFNLLSDCVRRLAEGLGEPTEVQRKAIPLVLGGGNVLITAPTGSGKTESAFLPALDLYLKDPSFGIGILYITPLKSLNRDMILRVEKYAQACRLRAEVRHGDTSQYERGKQLKNPPQVLIVTPETLQAILTAKKFRENLRGVRHVIVDEVHELAGSKRGSQLAVGLERLANLAGEFQRIGLSATVGSREEVARFLCGNRDCEIVSVSTAKTLEVSVFYPKPSPADRESAHNIFATEETFAKIKKIVELVESHESALIFTNTREAAEVLSSRIRAWKGEYPIGVHHSSLSREARLFAEEGLKSSQLKGIICTSSLELGIDVGGIDLVIQSGSPRQVSKLLQRAGRSGHSVGKKSKCVIVSSGFYDLCESVSIAEKALKEELEPQKLHRDPLDVLANQIMGMLMEGYDSEEKILECLRRSYPFSTLGPERFRSVVSALSDARLLWYANGLLKKRAKSFEYYFGNLSMIPDERQYSVINIVDRVPVARLDEGFILGSCEEGNTFVCRGTAWRTVGREEDKLFVEPSSDISSAIPTWEGEMLPVPFGVAQDVGRRLEKFKGSALLNEDGNIEIKKILEKQEIIPSDKRVLVEASGKSVLLHAFFGSAANEALGKLLSSVFSGSFGTSVGVRTDPYCILLETPEAAHPQDVVSVLKNIEPASVRPAVIDAIGKSARTMWRAVQIAKKFGIIEKNADLSKIGMRRLSGLLQKSVLFDEVVRELLLEKVDVERAEGIISGIKKGEIELIAGRGLSALGTEKLASMRSFDIVSPKKPDREILDLFLRRLLNKRISLVCLNCGDWAESFRISSLGDTPACGKCKARLLGVVKGDVREARVLVKKRLSGRLLAPAEKEKFRRVRWSADLVLTYGKRGIIALSARGVGPQNAVRVLARDMDESGFLRGLLEAERTYARTKRFWQG